MHYRYPPLLPRARSLIRCLLPVATLVVGAADAFALDKQGAAHSGPDTDAAGGTVPRLQLSGQLFLGVLPYNPTYAARPDNTGRALLRAGGHLDIDVLGERLFFPLDVNLFTDRDAAPVRPSELDIIGGVASTAKVGRGKAELGVRGEWDTTADGRGTGRSSQGYVDVRTRYVTSLGQRVKALDHALGGGDISGWLTLGWFAWNPIYYARPDNTGRALFRYAAHVDTSFWRERLAVFVDGTFFTDRTANPIRPSELDLTVGLSLALGQWGGMLGYERDMPIDGRGSGLVQHMVMAQASCSFAWAGFTRTPPSAGL